MISSLQALKENRLREQRPFPLWALLYMYEVSNQHDTYIGYMEGFKLLKDWLSPIDIPQAPVTMRKPKLFHSYELQEIAVILQTNQYNIYHGYQTTLSFIQQPSNCSCLSQKVPTLQIECTHTAG